MVQFLKFVFIVIIFLVQLFDSSVTQQSEYVLNIPAQGPIRGSTGRAIWTGETFWQFLGIPYGESPSGYKRFKPPEKKRPWREIFDATHEKMGCPTAWFPKSDDGRDAEDCLHLSVYSKKLQGSAPVMVVLHGEMWLDSERSRQPPDYLMSKDIVLVVPQYRSGALGFLSTLTPAIPGNAGIFDAALALEWVQQNIRYFGGDPARVTLVGQSGGAVIAHVLSISPKIPQNLFRQLILQSGTALSPTVIRRDPMAVVKLIAAFSNCGNYTEVDVLNNCLMTLPIEDLVTSAAVGMLFNENEIPDNIGVKLTIGDYNGLLPEKPLDLVRLEQTRKYPMLAGVTKHDGVFAVDDELAEMKFAGPHMFERKHITFDYISGFLKRLGVDDSTGAVKNLFRMKVLSQYKLSEGDLFHMIPDLIDIASIVTMKAPILQTAKHNVGNGEGRTFLYTFNYKGEFTRFGYGDNKTESPYDGGVCHNNENIYLFPTPEAAANLNEDDTEIAKMMVEIWTNFVTSGIPYASGFPAWPPFQGKEGPYMKINRRSIVGQDFFDEFFVTSEDELEGNSLLRPKYKDHLAPLNL